MFSLCILVIASASPCPSTMRFLPYQGPETMRQTTMDWNPYKCEKNPKQNLFPLCKPSLPVSVMATRNKFSVGPKLINQIPTKYLNCLKSLSVTRGNSQTLNRYILDDILVKEKMKTVLLPNCIVLHF